MNGLIGSKIGMTSIFDKNGYSVSVTVINIQINRITQIKNIKNDGYNAIQVTTGYIKNNKINKPQYGHFIKSNVIAGYGLWEFRIKHNNNFYVGQNISLELLKNVKKVDITGFSKGKGFAGTVKRWNFKTQDATHGNSLSHRVPGSIGQNQTPGRVFKGKKMAGRIGNRRTTIQNLTIVQIDTERNLLLIKGAVPGTLHSNLIIKIANKI